MFAGQLKVGCRKKGSARIRLQGKKEIMILQVTICR
jgi:hypothetical protein